MTIKAPSYPPDTRAKGWRFEVDMEAIKASDTWLLAKTGAVRGALLLLWSEAWQQTPCGTLPNDDELIALMIDMPLAAFGKHRKVLMRGWGEASDGRLYHDTITKRVLAMLDKRASDAKRAATRRAKAADPQKTHSEAPPESRVTHEVDRSEFDTKHQAPSTSSSVPVGTGAASAADAPAGELPSVAQAITALEAVAIMNRVEGAPLSDDDEKLLWAGGRALFALSNISAENAGKFVGKLIKENGNDRALVFDVLRAACLERPIDPRGWMTATCQSRRGQRVSTNNRQTDLEAQNQAAADAFANGTY